MIKLFLVPILVVALLSIGQVGFKIVGSRATSLDSLLTLQTLVPLALVLGLYAIATLAWIYVLSYMNLNRAFMFYALTFIFVPLLAWGFFGEQITGRQIVGAALIVAGVVFSTL